MITTDAEFKVLRDRAASLRQQNKYMRTGMEDLQKQCHELLGRKDKHSQKKLKALLIQIEENSTALETVSYMITSEYPLGFLWLFSYCTTFHRYPIFNKKKATPYCARSTLDIVVQVR